MFCEVDTVALIQCKGQLQAIIVGRGVDLCVKNTYVLVCSQSVIIGW